MSGPGSLYMRLTQLAAASDEILAGAKSPYKQVLLSNRELYRLSMATKRMA
jgi:hypothetical protein